MATASSAEQPYELADRVGKGCGSEPKQGTQVGRPQVLVWRT
jgi:hypothetical protein